MSVRSDTQRSSLEKGRVINFPYYIFSCVFKMNYYSAEIEMMISFLEIFYESCIYFFK